MVVFTYDGSFEGILTCVFESYRLNIDPDKLVTKENHQPAFYETLIEISTENEKAKRVYKGLEGKVSSSAKQMIYQVFLSELHEAPLLILKFIRLAYDSKVNIEENFGNAYVLKMNQINKMIGREVHRMHAFVRFKKTVDNLYYAVISPDFNVIPLIGEHFEKRYADQQWLIYDLRRKSAIYFDLKEVTEVRLEQVEMDKNGTLPLSLMNDQNYEELWQEYFNAVNIKERKNLKLHIRHIPIRYWKYLPEKKGQNGSK